MRRAPTGRREERGQASRAAKPVLRRSFLEDRARLPPRPSPQAHTLHAAWFRRDDQPVEADRPGAGAKSQTDALYRHPRKFFPHAQASPPSRVLPSKCRSQPPADRRTFMKIWPSVLRRLQQVVPEGFDNHAFSFPGQTPCTAPPKMLRRPFFPADPGSIFGSDFRKCDSARSWNNQWASFQSPTAKRNSKKAIVKARVSRASRKIQSSITPAQLRRRCSSSAPLLIMYLFSSNRGCI